MPRGVLQTVNKSIPVQVWNVRLREFGIAHREDVDACMELRMNWSIFSSHPPLHHVQEFFRVMMTAVETWQLSCSAWTNRKTQATLQHTRTYVEICHRGALSRHHGTVTGGARGGCLCSLRSVCGLDLSSCDILSHGCCYREWADQTEETSTGATLRPTLDQPTEEEPQ